MGLFFTDMISYSELDPESRVEMDFFAAPRGMSGPKPKVDETRAMTALSFSDSEIGMIADGSG